MQKNDNHFHFVGDGSTILVVQYEDTKKQNERNCKNKTKNGLGGV